MFNFSFGELLILGIIGLLVIGPKQLPQMAKILARTINEFKKSISDVTNTVKSEIKADVFKKQIIEDITEEPKAVEKEEGES